MDFYLGPSSLPGKHQGTKKASQGLSFIELMIVIIIICILAIMAIPSFIAQIQRYRLTSTMQEMYYYLTFARSEALKEAKTIYVSFQTGNNWCYGINSGSACNCSSPSACGLGSYTPSSQLTTLSLSGITTLTFEGSRGTTNNAGTITLTVTGGSLSMGIDVGTLGNLTLCSNTISGYPTC